GDILRARGMAHDMRIVPTSPTASLRRRARQVAERVASSLIHNHHDPIHLIGHSTGGLDARLLASPSTSLGIEPELMRWRKQLRSIVSINTPHHGTPLAQFFTTVSGTRLLYALSLLTFTSLKLGGRPLTVFSSVVAAAERIDDVLGVKIEVLDRATNLVLRYIGEKSQSEVRHWLDGIRKDQGGIVQITPESLDLFNATTENADSVRYGCLVSASPPPAPVRLLGSIRSPYAALSATIYSTVYAIAARPHPHYPYPAPSVEALRKLTAGLEREVSQRSNDGIVPTLSMLWGQLLWCGRGDHLDVVGHFADDVRPSLHTDWLSCGSRFSRERFHQSMLAIADFLAADG
ncbi:MAG: esterase/lipase family protein, partial [Polyangiales bacterium]